jgi:hypothetical protein
VTEQAGDERGLMSNGTPRFGEQPLPQTVAVAGALRRLTGLLLSLENDHPTVDAMVTQIAEWERELTSAAPPDPTPRIGPQSTDTQRVYLDHAFDVGAYNPCFPEYAFDTLDADAATGRVTFPVVYEGPPGLVNGGFLAVFFDCVTQHQSCASGRTGKTRSLTVTFRRPTPVLVELGFDVVRAEADGRVTSTARLLLGDEVLCIGEFSTAASSPDKLSVYDFGRRRVTG